MTRLFNVGSFAVVFFISLPSSAAGGSGSDVSGSAVPADPKLTSDEYRKGLGLLRKYLQSRGEKPEVIDQFVGDLERAAPPPRPVFAAFLSYEQAWARKTRDGKNDHVSKAQLQREADKANELKNKFKQLSRGESPGFLAAFQDAVKDVRAQRAARNPGAAAAGSAAAFGDHIDDSYTQVDAGDEALQNGDAAGAAAAAGQALAENPSNADAQALLAGAEYAQGNMPAAAQDAQKALALDPSNQQAQAIVALANPAPAAAPNSAADAQALGQSLSAGAPQPPAAATAVDPPISVHPLVPAPPPATPALASRLSSDLATQASRTLTLDAAGALPQIDRALALDPTNARAWNLRSAAASRGADFPAALAAADQAIALDPRGGRGYFSRARALAGEGDRQGMIDALRQAATLDVNYEQKLQSALQLPQDADLNLLFPRSLDAAPPPTPKNREFPAVMILGAIGALLVLLALLSLVPKKKRDR